jgi:hypothetical protein
MSTASRSGLRRAARRLETIVIFNSQAQNLGAQEGWFGEFLKLRRHSVKLQGFDLPAIDRLEIGRGGGI